MTTNKVNIQLSNTEQKKPTKLRFDLKASFYVINTTATKYFERIWINVRWDW